jgi:hypothetical protein
MRNAPPARDRILSRVAVDSYTGCWEWTGAVGRDGYGVFKDAGKQWRAHRAAYHFLCDPIPEGVQVLHRCDNTRCVRPEHLFLGDHRANMADAAAKGRRKGERNARAKLTDAQVAEIYALRGQARQVDIARTYGVSQATVSHIQIGRTRAA